MAIATAAALTELEWLTSPALEHLFQKSISLLGSDYGKDLEDLDTSLLPQIQRTIQAPQYSPHKAQLARWFKRLKEAYYDAEDILDELQYECLSRKVERKTVREYRKLWVRVSSKPVIKSLAKFADPAVKRSSLLSPLKKKLLDRLKKLKEIAAEAKTFHDLLGIQNTESNDAILTGNSSSVTSSFLIGRVFGRYGKREAIINFLLDKQGGSSLKNSYSVVAVTGIRGVGKTTLVQYVYNDERVKNHFGVRMWLCLSQKFDTIDLIKEMIECASEKECPNLSSLDVLQDKLIETLPKSEKIMVVLDDAWYDNNDKEVGENKWNDLVKPLIKFASQGGTCKIVVTSRSASFPSALQPGKLIELSNLARNDSISLLRYHAIDGLQINDPQLKNDLSDIVDQLRLPVPLAAKVVGNQMRERPDIKFWQAILENVNLSTDDGGSNIVDQNVFLDIDFNDLVKDSREKVYQILGLLELKHEVQCLKNVSAFQSSLLQKNNIKTVEDFLKLYYNDEPALRMILGIKSESDKDWKSMVKHAKQCAIEFHAKCKDLNNSSQCVQRKVVMKNPSMIDKKTMTEAMKAVSSINGVSSIQAHPEEQKMTISGQMDTVSRKYKFGRLRPRPQILSVGPARAGKKARKSSIARDSPLARSLTARSIVNRAVTEPSRSRLGPK